MWTALPFRSGERTMRFKRSTFPLANIASRSLMRTRGFAAARSFQESASASAWLAGFDYAGSRLNCLVQKVSEQLDLRGGSRIDDFHNPAELSFGIGANRQTDLRISLCRRVKLRLQ